MLIFRAVGKYILAEIKKSIYMTESKYRHFLKNSLVHYSETLRQQPEQTLQHPLTLQFHIDVLNLLASFTRATLHQYSKESM